MRKISSIYLPATMLLAFLAMVLLTCGGGGGDGGGGLAVTGLSVSGPSSVSEYDTATYTATATFADNTTSTVTPTWEVDLQTASISSAGELYCQGIDNDEMATVTATYSSGGVTETATMDVTITNVVTIPFTEQMLSGQAFFEENTYEGGGYDSHLTIYNADFSWVQYVNNNYDDSHYGTGTWSIDASGNAIITGSDGGTAMVMLISDSSTEMQVVVQIGTEPPYTAIVEKIISVDTAKVPGTYTLSGEDSTWVFNVDGTGSTTLFGGCNYTWSVDTGILKTVFLDCSQYKPQFYARAGSQSDATSYTLLKVAPVEFTPTDAFYFYYGGGEFTRQ